MALLRAGSSRSVRTAGASAPWRQALALLAKITPGKSSRAEFSPSGSEAMTEARGLQGHDRDALRCGRCFVKASSVWIAGVLQSTTDRPRIAQLASNRRLSRAAAVRRWDVERISADQIYPR